MTARWRCVLSGAGLFAASIAAAGPAHAAEPACGATITVDTVLEADLACAGDGLIVAAPDVVLDLGGHRIAGTGTAFGAGSTATGVRVLAAASGVTVRNGSILGFGAGLDVPRGADDADLTGLAVMDNVTGIRLASSHSQIRGNLVRTTSLAMNLGGDGNRVVGNAVYANAAGIASSGTGLTIFANSIVGDGAHDAGVLLIGASGARVSGNSVSGSLQGSGISVHFSGGAEVTGNRVFGNRDGISTSGPVRISGNVAFSNISLGIRAPGAIDGGGNRGFGNGNPQQCTGVACA